MLRPAMSQIIKKDDSYYRFVVAVAKRAREIAEEAEEEKIPLEEKPVKLAVEEFAAGKYKMTSHPDL
ncbi:DNA-directed RNA polymerase subunit omega [Merdimmobilis hominis]|jgi:DNA-directed RNA polymerase subunit omega|uniref:DNA-directed RNA polymerase subunit omega n=1 Tax=uncultured Anaerotruncus sp. TaxID=905011 RepID=A0A6N2V6I9_9FIRM|nr:DNA-directed RNA polymerase subunit omega [Merdimmobilis hominis]MCD4837088.1 DNA-directed RNA polymerase subunit omega [Merdimmobilis hominis]PWL58329.1 MAG: DNA-directed RNA polymerase subunit omega [Oscillospiraceae bacterium]